MKHSKKEPSKAKKAYKQVMPLDTEQKVSDQFGWVPKSVFVPEKRRMLEALISDIGDPDKTRRSSKCKYLPSLRYSKFHPHLAEMVVRYWSMPNELIVDPFSGRSTRGVISTYLKRQYTEYEIVSKVAKQTHIKNARIFVSIQKT